MGVPTGPVSVRLSYHAFQDNTEGRARCPAKPTFDCTRYRSPWYHGIPYHKLAQELVPLLHCCQGLSPLPPPYSCSSVPPAVRNADKLLDVYVVVGRWALGGECSDSRWWRVGGELGGVARKRQKNGDTHPPGHTFPCVAAGSPQTVWCVPSHGHDRFRCLESRSRGGRGERGGGVGVGWCGGVGCLGSPARMQETAPGRTRPPPRRGMRTSPEQSPIARLLHPARCPSHTCA